MMDAETQEKAKIEDAPRPRFHCSYEEALVLLDRALEVKREMRRKAHSLRERLRCLER
jgi:hypothetical protein